MSDDLDLDDYGPECPNLGDAPDHCDQCHGWGHLCPLWTASHPAQVGEVARAYNAGYDPTRFYPSVEACEAGEAETATRRRGASGTVRTRPEVRLACPDCGGILTDQTTLDGQPSYCDLCDREV